jgi:hypothetical protein
MSLTKRLQRELTCTDQPWIPPKHPIAARLVNEIVLGEETDEMPEGGYLSHYEMYLAAMEEIGADTSQVKQFIDLVHDGMTVNDALNKVGVHPGIQSFVNHTMHIVNSGNLYQVLGNFFFGREDVIPKMFKALLNNWHLDEENAPMFVYYLNRHIELDSDSHGPAVWRIINEMTKDKPETIEELKDAARKAINARIQLWDGLTEIIQNKQKKIA